MVKMKICIASSAGGHLVETNKLLPIFKKHDFFYITFKIEKITKKLPGRTYHVINPDVRNRKLGISAFLFNLIQVCLIIIKEKPDVVVTTGATVAFPVCYISKFLLSSKIIFIETMARVDTRSLTGILLYPISDVFIVQWKSLLDLYGDKAIHGGLLL